MDLPNSALEAFAQSISPECVWAQVLIKRLGTGFELRHLSDRDIPLQQLTPVQLGELRKLATFNPLGQFRPLRAAPDLRTGWLCECGNNSDLWRAIQELYPGSIPDWYAARHEPPPVTDYRPFTHRQSGMYRITQLLSDAQAGQVIRACCHARFCLKRRLWSVEGLLPDDPAAKSSIPCLEPCAVLLELARKATRIEQEEKMDVQLSRSELESLLTATKQLVEQPGRAERVGDIASAVNSRRLQLILEKFGPALESSAQPREP